MSKTTIEWTEYTFNPWWGCTKISEGCAKCYAETFSRRVGFAEGGSKFPIWGDSAERRFFGDKRWAEPLRWNAAAEKLGVMHRVFCGSMCDILEDREDVVDARKRAFALVEDTPNLLWLFLTKRPENAGSMLPRHWSGNGWWPRNAMLGVTIENQKRLEERMPCVEQLHHLFPGIHMFASCEPLLSGLDWRSGNYDLLQFFDWVIGGGESSPGARPMHPDWIRKLRDDCAERTDMGRPWPVPFLFKQWGEYMHGSAFRADAVIVLNDGRTGKCGDGFDQATVNAWPRYRSEMMAPVGKKAAGRTLDGCTWDGVPHLPYGPQLPGIENYGACEVPR